MSSLSSAGVTTSKTPSQSAPVAALMDPKARNKAVADPISSNPNPTIDLNNASLDGLNDQWNNMTLATDVEHNAFEFVNPLMDPNQNASYYLVGTVRALEEIPSDLVEKIMKTAWNPRYGMEMSMLEPNLYLFRFNHRIDINKVIREGPWRVKDFTVATKEVPEDVMVPKDQLVIVPFWVQIHGLPSRWIREDLIRFIGQLLGRVQEVDATVRRERASDPEFARVRVEVNTSARLLRGTNITLQGRDIPVAFKYERLFNFCYYCGTIDHVLDNCIEAVKPDFNPSMCLYGDWLRGIPPRPRPWTVSRFVPMPGYASNPFMPRVLSIPPGFRALGPSAPPPALPAPVVRAALPPPQETVSGNPSVLALSEQVEQNGQRQRSTYKKREPKPRGDGQCESSKEANGEDDPGANGKRRRGGGGDGSSGGMGDLRGMD